MAKHPPTPQPSLRGALPVLATLVVWVVGGWFTWNVAVAHGWTQGAGLRTGTMAVTSCHRDPLRAFQVYRCAGQATFAPEDTWRAHRDYLRTHPDVPLLSRTDLTGRAVAFTTTNQRNQSGNDWKRSDTPVEVAFPDDQLGRSYAAPLLWALGVAVGGVAAFPLTLRLTRPEADPG